MRYARWMTRLRSDLIVTYYPWIKGDKPPHPVREWFKPGDPPVEHTPYAFLRDGQEWRMASGMKAVTLVHVSVFGPRVGRVAAALARAGLRALLWARRLPSI